jgi:predicted permease
MVTGVLVKLALLPAVAVGIGMLVGLEGAALLVAAIFAALPSSASGYHMARQMGGDGPLIAGIITAQTLLAMASLPLIILLVR